MDNKNAAVSRWRQTGEGRPDRVEGTLCFFLCRVEANLWSFPPWVLCVQTDCCQAFL